MAIKNTDLTFNTDGSVDLPGKDEKPIRFVKESDLLAVKGSSEAKATEWGGKEATYNTQLAESNRLREESHQALLKEQAAKEQMVSKYQDYDTLKTKVGELEKTVGSHKESVGKHEKELADRIRHSLITYNGAKEEALKDKTLDQLRNIEEAAKIFSGDGKKIPARYDAGGPPGGPTGESNTERAKRIIEEHEAKMGRPAKVSNIAIK